MLLMEGDRHFARRENEWAVWYEGPRAAVPSWDLFLQQYHRHAHHAGKPVVMPDGLEYTAEELHDALQDAVACYATCEHAGIAEEQLAWAESIMQALGFDWF